MQKPLVRVWLLASNQGPTDGACDVLREDEKHECSRFANRRDANAFAITRAALRCLLGSALGIPPDAVQLARNPWGKPLLASARHRPDFDFSVSHTGERSIIALSWCGPVGVDIEQRRHQVSEMNRIAAQVFGEPTAAALNQFPPERRNDAFLRLWTSGEACLKAAGIGLAAAGGRVPVTLSASGSTQVDDAWTLQPLDLPSDCIGALATRSAGAARLACASPEVTDIARLISGTR